MRWLCISDVHGDAHALAAVLATAERWGYDKLLVAGDICFGSGSTHDVQPLEVWRRLTQARATCVQGVSDRAIATLDPGSLRGTNPRERQRLEDLARVRTELGDLILARLLKLPLQMRLPLPDGGELMLVHGSPVDPTEPFTHDMTETEMRALIGDDPADVIVCGGSHVPFDRTVMGVRVVNVGSVGEAPSGGRLEEPPGTRTRQSWTCDLREAVPPGEPTTHPIRR
jgi:predicted phosphodiesterase